MPEEQTLARFGHAITSASLQDYLYNNSTRSPADILLTSVLFDFIFGSKKSMAGSSKKTWATVRKKAKKHPKLLDHMLSTLGNGQWL
jgi:hypothetical protein